MIKKDIKSTHTYLSTLTCSVIIPVFDLAFTLDLFILYCYMILDRKPVLNKYTEPFVCLSVENRDLL